MVGMAFFTSSSNSDAPERVTQTKRTVAEENEYMQRRKNAIALYGDKPAAIFNNKLSDNFSFGVPEYKKEVAKNHAVLIEGWYTDTPGTEKRKKAIEELGRLKFSTGLTPHRELFEGIDKILWAAVEDQDEDVAIAAFSKVSLDAFFEANHNKSSEGVQRLCTRYAQEERPHVKAKMRELFLCDSLVACGRLEKGSIALKIVDVLADAPTFSPAYVASDKTDKQAMEKVIADEKGICESLKKQTELATDVDIVRSQKDTIAKKVLNTLVSFSKDVRNKQVRVEAIEGIRNLVIKKPSIQGVNPDFDRQAFTALSEAALHEKNQKTPSKDVVSAATVAMLCLLSDEGFAAENDIVNTSKEKDVSQIGSQECQFLHFFRLFADTCLVLMEDSSEDVCRDSGFYLKIYFQQAYSKLGYKGVCEKYFEQNLGYVRNKVQAKLDAIETIGEKDKNYLELLANLACAEPVLSEAPNEAVAIANYLEAQLDNENKKEAVLPYVEKMASNKSVAPNLQLRFLKKGGVFEYRENAEDVNQKHLEVMANLSHKAAFDALHECNQKLDTFDTEGKKLTQILDNPVVQWLHKSHVALESNLIVA